MSTDYELEALEAPPAALVGQAGELHFTVTVTRAATGAVETYEMVGKVTSDQLEEIIHGSNT